MSFYIVNYGKPINTATLNAIHCSNSKMQRCKEVLVNYARKWQN
jgi:hypothetical protein